MKPPAEMHEGPEALKRFEDTMQNLFTKRKGDLPRRPSRKKNQARKGVDVKPL